VERKWFGDRAHIDEEKVNQSIRSKAELRRLIELGSEDEFVAYMKSLRPGISKQELLDAIALFREEHQRHLRGSRHRP